MKEFLKLLGLVFLLNIARYFFGGLIESLTIMEVMHAPMMEFQECFNISFDGMDWATSFFYNFLLWFCTAWLFHIAHGNVSGNFILKSFKIYGIMFLFFISLTAVYMNHYVDGIKTFYLYAMVDALITFSVVALANGLLYPRIFGRNSKGEL